MSDRITAAQRQMLQRLPRQRGEWLDVSWWSRARQLRLMILQDRGLVVLWHTPEPHARLTLEGERMLNRLAVE